MNSGLRTSRTDLLICLGLVLATLGLYSQVRNFDFVNYDDAEYVSRNPHLPGGMSAAGLKWAFTSIDGLNWFPLTRLSYILEYRLFGLESGAYHLTNLLLHVLASVLLFVFLLRATNARWPSAFAAFLFAVHPLHVESVAWVAERKDVLCAVFWFLTLWAWVRYAENPAPLRYMPALLLFCCGLMSKPMIVTLPFVLLLLDVWPLRRTGRKNLVVEKLPFFALSAAVVAVTYFAQRSGGAVQSLGKFPLGLRIENAIVSSIVYIAQMFWPARLAVIYPYPKQVPVWQAVAAGLVLASVSALALRSFRKFPYLAVGWFWYLGMLVPVIGLVQVGIQARADRYMYLPMVGLSIMLSWGAADVVRHWPRTRPLVAALAALALLALAPVTWLQLRYWENAQTLFRHALDATAGNSAAWVELSAAIRLVPGRMPDAISVLETGLRALPDDDQIQTELGETLLLTNVSANIPAAVDHLRAALKINPGNGTAQANLAAASLRLGRPNEAAGEARMALRVNPDLSSAHYYLATALFMQGKVEESIGEAHAALRIKPDYAEAHQLLGSLLQRVPGRFGEAIQEYREALRIKPAFVEAHVQLGTALSRVPGATFEALSEFEEALRIAPDFRLAHVSMGLLLARIPGRRAEAIAHLQTALTLGPDPRLQQVVDALQSQTPR